MNRCESCGRPIAEAEAYARLTIAGRAYLICCPMCRTAFEAGHWQKQMILGSFADPRVSVMAEYLPALQIGGDYACLRAGGEDTLYLIVADVSGHGIAASLIMNRISAEIEWLVEQGAEVSILAAQLNEIMRSIPGDDSFYLTLFASVLNFSSQTLTYVNCGHPAQWLRRGQAFLPLESQSFPVGLFEADLFGVPRPGSVEVHPGDRLFLFTDGLIDLEREDGSELGGAGVRSLCQELTEACKAGEHHRIFERIRDLQKAQMHDDVLIVCLGIND